MGDLLKNLQRIGDCELDDITVAHEALAEIVDLRLRIAELEAENARLRDEIQSAIYAMSCPVSASGSGALAILRKALIQPSDGGEG